MSIRQIRELLPTDDFAKIAEMTYRLFFDQKIRCAPKPKHIKRDFFDEHDQFYENVISYVSVKDQEIVAIVGIELSPHRRTVF